MRNDDIDIADDEELVEIFRVLGDRVRWSILRQLAEVEELPCSQLETTLPVSKPTISYHVKLLRQVGLIAERKQGRNYFYRFQREVFQELVDRLRASTPPRLLVDGEQVDVSAVVQRHREGRLRTRVVENGTGQVVPMLTW